jgi:hypothetical protein
MLIHLRLQTISARYIPSNIKEGRKSNGEVKVGKEIRERRDQRRATSRRIRNKSNYEETGARK